MHRQEEELRDALVSPLDEVRLACESTGVVKPNEAETTRQQPAQKARIQRKAKHYRGLFERRPGEWWVCYFDAQGRKRREKAGTWETARDLYIKRKNQAIEGKKLPEKLRKAPVVFSEIARDALAYSKAHKRTHEDDEQRMERILECFRNYTADSITPAQIERFLEDGIELRSKRGKNWKPSTINHYRSLLSLTYRLAIRNGKVSSNPARATRHRRENNSRIRYLSIDEEAQLRKAIAEKWPEHLPELDLALNTGLRLSEMYGLTWNNVNPAGKILAVPRSKNGDARYVRLNVAALGALAILSKRAKGSGPVIRTPEGDPLAGPRYWWDKAIAKAGIHDFRWHDLRHTFASRLVMAGVTLRAVQEVMGHKSIAMTVRYSHLSPDFQLDAVERLAVYNAANASSVQSTGSIKEGATDTTSDTGAENSVKAQMPVAQEPLVMQ